MANQLDDAFNWLVVILGIIAGALTQFPQLAVFGWYLFPEQASQVVPLNVDYLLLRSLIFPVVFLALFWLLGFLTIKSEWQVMLKFFSWISASIILIVDLLLLGVFTIIHAYYPPAFWSTWIPEEGPPIVIVVTALFSYSLLVIFPLLFSFFVVRPRMREIYKDSKFLHSIPKQVLLFIMAVLFYLLLVGLLENILLGASSPSIPKWS